MSYSPAPTPGAGADLANQRHPRDHAGAEWGRAVHRALSGARGIGGNRAWEPPPRSADGGHESIKGYSTYVRMTDDTRNTENRAKSRGFGGVPRDSCEAPQRLRG